MSERKKYKVDERGSAADRARGYMQAMEGFTLVHNPAGMQSAALAAIAAWLEVLAEQKGCVKC